MGNNSSSSETHKLRQYADETNKKLAEESANSLNIKQKKYEPEILSKSQKTVNIPM